jgi:hypothetical protein
LGEHRTKDPAASDVLYVEASPPRYDRNDADETLLALADHGERKRCPGTEAIHGW